ncbi:SDR family oxidoreductase [Deinococcus maricopensis]|uniref:Short-chain dehydrogenase/reductase SDR n=1 Tax=Deinococcus maricopensis (strain DSM 21211 / LMG 22137 / NRRL B-23946 / LB-34) TaxID=709986 RepID=E8U975_DEIML|nr:SDR family oxidoreductase [Deinococcus maricopensis]ADV67614.1 short-chain dehydrogenase/reductase SDR [Deinococcus maricopensis DSM 21211]
MSTPTTLITGATGGIGRALADALHDHQLILAGRDADKLRALAEALPNAHTLTLDLHHPETFADALQDLGVITNVIHNAGVVDLGRVAEQDADVWTRTLAVNVVAPAALTRALLPQLRAARGHAVFINSGAGLRANAGWGSYAASKFALRALADVLREEEAAHGVRVTTVYPGRTDTDMQRKVRTQEGGEYQQDAYIDARSVAATVRFVLHAPRDADLTDVTVRPGVR